MRALLLSLCLATPLQAGAPPEALAALLRWGGSVARSNCTAVLTGAREARTAAHCAKEGLQALHAGWRAGRSVEVIRPVAARGPRVRPLAIYAQYVDQVRLDLPHTFAKARPLPIGPLPRAGEKAHVLSFPRGAAVPEWVACRIATATAFQATLDCPARSGMSGAPLLMERDGSWHVVGLVTSRIGDDASIAVALEGTK